MTIRPTQDLLFLSQEDVIASGGTDMKAAIADVRKGFALYGDNHVRLPHKTTLKAVDDESTGCGIVNFLPSYIKDGTEEIFTGKSLGSMPSNLALGLPRANGLITIFDGATKAPVCIMEAAVISAMRTGAVSGVGAPLFVDPAVEEVGLIGAGVNMRTQLLALHQSMPNLRHVKVYSRGQSKYDFAEQMGARLSLDIEAVETSEAAVRDMLMVVTCVARTSDFVVDHSWITPGATVFAIGAYEVDPKALADMDRIVVDSWQHCRHRGGRTDIEAIARGYIKDTDIEDLGPILSSQKPGRENPVQSIYFAPVGMGFLDGLVAQRIYKNAVAQDRGTKLLLHEQEQWI